MAPDDSRPNVVLTGFMGTGKTTIARVLARRLGYEMVDTDQRIEADHGPIPLIFAEQGEAAFRSVEAEVAAELAGREGLVIATGGRLMLDPENARRLGASGRVFCLTAEPTTIIARVTADGIDERPLLAGADPDRRIRELLAERAGGYGRFEAVPTDGRTPEEIAGDIIERLGPSAL